MQDRTLIHSWRPGRRNSLLYKIYALSVPDERDLYWVVVQVSWSVPIAIHIFCIIFNIISLKNFHITFTLTLKKKPTRPWFDPLTIKSLTNFMISTYWASLFDLCNNHRKINIIANNQFKANDVPNLKKKWVHIPFSPSRLFMLSYLAM